MERQAHRSPVYQTKDAGSVSWYEDRPTPSLRMIEAAGLPPGSPLLDVGGGASNLADALGEAGRYRVELHTTPAGAEQPFLLARFVRSPAPPADRAGRGEGHPRPTPRTHGPRPLPAATPMRFRFESVLDAPADEVWAMVQRTELLREVAGPLLQFRSASAGGLPRSWPVGAPLHLRMYLFGLIPLGPHEIVVERIDDRARELQTRERGALLRRWAHLIRVEPTGPHRTRYTDELDLDAGLLTPLVGAFSRAFFWYRHRRWRAVARRIAARPNAR
jgi:hypothetical protein